MNERIKELANEAAKYSATMFLPTGEDGDELFVKKFAELIVKECMDKIIEDPLHAGAQLAERIRKYFGVEEYESN